MIILTIATAKTRWNIVNICVKRQDLHITEFKNIMGCGGSDNFGC